MLCPAGPRSVVANGSLRQVSERRRLTGVLVARSLEEARLYLDLHPHQCGYAGRYEPEFTLSRRDGQRVAVYQGTCAGCSERRRDEFAVPEVAVAGYGADEPSRILDAGEFLWTSDRAAEQAAALAGSSDQAELASARGAIDVAIDALHEVLKFGPVGSADQLGSDLGKKVYDANPDRFTPDRLQQRLELLLDARSRLERAPA